MQQESTSVGGATGVLLPEASMPGLDLPALQTRSTSKGGRPFAQWMAIGQNEKADVALRGPAGQWRGQRRQVRTDDESNSYALRPPPVAL